MHMHVRIKNRKPTRRTGELGIVVPVGVGAS
jgi:hypothetical protein